MTPEKLHLALNHVVILLPLAALVPLIAGLCTKSRVTLISGAAIALAGSLMTGVVMGSGEETDEGDNDGPVGAYPDARAEAELGRHEARAHTWAKVMYALAAASLASLVIAFAKPQWLRPASRAVIVLCVASVMVGVYIADSGGDIRRPDFRDRPPDEGATTSPETARDPAIPDSF